MANIVIPFAAVALAVVPSVGFNNNFTEIATKFNTYAVQTDVAKVITASHTWNASQTMGGDLLFTDGLYDVGKTGATRPRDGFFSRNFTIGQVLTVVGNSSLSQLAVAFGVKAGTNQQAVFGTTDANAFQLTFTNNTNTSFDITAIEQSVAFRLIRINPVSGGVQLASAGQATQVMGTFSVAGLVVSDLTFTDATYDIGKAGATRPRDGFFSRNMTIGGTLLVSGNVVGDLLFTDGLYDIGKAGATRPRHGYFSGNVTPGGQLDMGTGHVRQGTTTAGVAAVATAIYSMGSASSALVLVIGGNGVDLFQDLVAHAPAKAPQVISSFTVSGAPAVRTYTSTTTPLLLAMASGTYTIKTLPFEVI